MQDTATKSNARLATLDQLIETTFPAFIDPIPCKLTLRTWLDKAQVPRIKANPIAKHGGGKVWYSVSHVEKMIRSRMLPGRLAAQEAA
jgi:hypothetical protein